MRTSLLTSIDATSHIHLIIGTNALAASRCAKSLEVGATPIVIFHPDECEHEVHPAMQQRIDDKEVKWLAKPYHDDDISTLGRPELDGYVDAVFVTLSPQDPLSLHISTHCKRHRVPINVLDAPSLCTFSLLSTHTDGPLQIGITTNGKGWLSQICEYWPLSRLADVTDADIEAVMTAYTSAPSASPSLTSTGTITTSTSLPTLPSPPPAAKKGLVILAGSGPGHPDLLTRSTHRAIHSATLILADKLVPAPILALIPRRTPLHIARKFPGNAERAQEELMALALAGLRRGETVLRLKQGDPYLYGRGGEEVEFFRKEGWGDKIVVLPGITSAFSAPLFAGVPATQRGVADQVLVCTGTGRKGVPTKPPTYVETQTVVFLMALHRISGLVEDLTTFAPEAAAISPTPASTDTATAGAGAVAGAVAAAAAADAGGLGEVLEGWGRGGEEAGKKVGEGGKMLGGELEVGLELGI
ncbi:hypothetical protein VE01_02682 [Pseudogymnoascus verrucosus]|uniref:Tetrapyrrole methylase domain-containing protein n=1 Tax=Pseudogymnoascus verrucosus TaxID=342668 RepID=A0A1B8GTP3_9PEZI|nr:uncharacterized protein VE01_02682 [Pseudogymnoascus verrucosus]OBT99203.1 hypothetical protein VE01_02682 [Pseudogymnoascus verrucosus]